MFPPVTMLADDPAFFLHHLARGVEVLFFGLQSFIAIIADEGYAAFDAVYRHLGTLKSSKHEDLTRERAHHGVGIASVQPSRLVLANGRRALWDIHMIGQFPLRGAVG